MTVFVAQEEDHALQLPKWVRDLSSFRRWARSDDFPQQGQYAFLNGDLWIDPSMEREGHNQVKAETSRVLATLIKDLDLGRFYVDGMGLVNVDADLATEPDGMFLSYAALKDERVRLARRENSLEIVGTPDMVLEVVSPTSVQKDTVLLRDLYWRADIPEYWLIDPRRHELVFDILRRGPKGYFPARKTGGWVKSAVFGKSFRLTRENDAMELAVYTLHVR
jgi:Uma2 family endonuclease